MAKNKTINVKGTAITVFQVEQSDYISLTDIAKHKDANNTDDIIKNCLRNRNTIELLGFGETMYNPNFKPVEFDGFRKQATLEQLVVLSNLESINAVLIHQSLPQSERLVHLNKIAITQMKSLVNSKQIKKLQ